MSKKKKHEQAEEIKEIEAPLILKIYREYTSSFSGQKHEDVIYMVHHQDTISLVENILDQQRKIEDLNKTIKGYQDAATKIMAA